MINYAADIQAFHEKFGLGWDGSPHQLPPELFRFRFNFMLEELNEYAVANNAKDMVGMLDALVDLLYVTFGTAYLHGFNVDEAWRRVHEANMKKVRGKTHRVMDGEFDVAKPEGWQPADLGDLV